MIDLLYAIQPIRKDYELKYDVKTQILEIFSLIIPGEHLSFKDLLVRLNFCILSRGRALVYYATDGKQIIHKSIVVPKCIKFRFMEKRSFEIGPCFTDPHYRGQRIYPNMLAKIITDISDSGGKTCYMLVSPQNKASISGIERAGFELIGKTERTRFLKIYKRIN